MPSRNESISGKEKAVKEKRIAHVGSLEVDINEVVRDPRGHEDEIVEIMENDFVEGRHSNFGGWITLLPDAADIAELDYALLSRYPPLYTRPKGVCTDCGLGPCNLKDGQGKCGLEIEAFQGRLSLRKASRGCMTQMVASRQLLNYALKRWPEDTPVSMGDILSISDHAPAISVLSGVYVKTIKDLDRVLSYGEEQLAKLFQASCSGTGTAVNFESMVLHAGSVLLLAMGVAEMLKISCYGFMSAANQELEGIEQYPPATLTGGWASIETGKPVVAFVGDDFLPAWCAIDIMKQSDSTEKLEICGIGAAGDDIVRFYDRGRVVAPMVRAPKAIRNGLFDVVVISPGCVPLDLLSEAERVDSKAIWVGHNGANGLADMTDEPVDKIVNALVSGAKAVWIRDPEKAGEVAVKVAPQVKRDGAHVISDADAVGQAKGHKKDCDLCSMVCPVGLPVSRAVAQLGGGDWAGFFEVEKGCNFCGRCEEACPSKVPLRDIIVASERKQAGTDKFTMRPGRGPISITELLQSAFAVGWGSIPAMATIFGCGDAHKDEIAWIANELLNGGCMVFVAGCAGVEVARSFNPTKKKYLFQEYNATCASRNIVNCGSCSAICHAVPMYLMLRPSGGIPLFGNIPPLGDSISLGGAQTVLLWGALPDRMYAVAAAWARLGSTVIVGPASSLGWDRYLVGNRYDRSKWWVHHGETGERREVEPVKEHMIVPVETKEEALTMLARSVLNVRDYRESRLTHLEVLIDYYERFYQQLPEDWSLAVRSDFELPPRHRRRMVSLLASENGWEVEGVKIAKAKHRDGRMMTMSEFAANYGMEQGIYTTRLRSQLPIRLRDVADEDKPKP
jgi:CO dehydrogenase/acetyl-CoA synthase complex epsilon subunit